MTATLTHLNAAQVNGVLAGWLAGLAVAFGLGVRFVINRSTWRDHAATKTAYHRLRKTRWITLWTLLKWAAFITLLTAALICGLVTRAAKDV